MFFFTIWSETLLYLCFSFLAGAFILRWIPTNSKPTIKISTSLQLFTVFSIALLSFIPLIQLIIHVAGMEGIGSAVESILLTFRIGNAWLFTFIICIVTAFYITIFGNDHRQIFIIGELFLLFLLTIGIAWSSHAGSIEGVYGIAIHTMHVLAVSVWSGILLIVGWFSSNSSNWLAFLRWFHPTAIGCFLLIIVSGILLMNVTTAGADYTDTFLVSYGQSLLLKHLFIIPLILYALINGFWMKQRIKKDPTYNPKPWVRVEFFIITIIFIITGALNEQSPPMNLENLIEHGGYAPLLNMFYNGSLEGSKVALIATDSGLFFAVIALICLIGSLYIYRMKKNATFSFLVSVIFVVLAYFAIIQSIVIS
ncbi:copper resistance D family protein [Oceanobacillus kimchii]|uniref:copper resistance D family protein n=1 Tax=Oceanobacillus kimchii TaxID=746691 RepID=UPI003C70876A